MAITTATAIAGASLALGAATAIKQGRAQSKAARAQAKSDELVAKQYNRNADFLQIQTAQEVENRLTALRSTLATTTAATAMNGMDVATSGSAAAVSRFSQAQAMRDIGNVKMQGRAEVEAARIGAEGALISARANRSAAKSYRTIGFLNAATSVASGAYKIWGT